MAVRRPLLLALLLALGASAQAHAQRPDCAADPNLLCPDLTMTAPSALDVDETRSGRLILRARNRIINLGDGPLELRGTRGGEPDEMPARQVIRRRDGGATIVPDAGEIYFKFVDRRRGSYWKFAHAARFELWSLDAEGHRLARYRTGPKLAYCFRDLRRLPTYPLGPTRRVFGACNQRGSLINARLGTSVGWADIYPPEYPDNWIDVTGLRGCFAFVHRADPNNHLVERREDNNLGTRTIQLPPRNGRVRPTDCP